MEDVANQEVISDNATTMTEDIPTSTFYLLSPTLIHTCSLIIKRWLPIPNQQQ